MTHVKIPDVDYARAKNAAKALKSRLHDLGNEVLLGHAYEAVAATLGFKTWAVLKAHLDGEVKAEPPSAQPDAPVYKSQTSKAALGWRDLKLGENNPVAMVHGPAGRKRDLVTMALAGHVDKYRRIRAIALGKPEEMAHALAGDPWHVVRGPGEPSQCSTICLDPASNSSSINIFDLPFRAARPSVSHLARIVSLLGEMTCADQVPAGKQFLSDAVNQLYHRFVDIAPITYKVGAVPEIDEFCSRAGMQLDDGRTTWRELALTLAGMLQPRLAGVAWRHGSPRLEHFMSAMRDDVVMDRYGSSRIAGELLVDVCTRMVSVAIRTYPFLQRPTAVDFGQRTVQIVGIEVPEGSSQTSVSLLFRLAFEASVMEYGEATEDALLVISGAEFVRSDLPTLLESAHDEDGPRIVFAADGMCIDDLDRFVTSHVVTGCSTRASVQDLCSRLKIGAAGFELIHERLFGSHDDSKVEAFCVRKKFVNQREGLVSIPVQIGAPDIGCLPDDARSGSA